MRAKERKDKKKSWGALNTFFLILGGRLKLNVRRLDHIESRGGRKG